MGTAERDAEVTAIGSFLLLVFSIPTECAAIANGNDLRGLGTCHQQAFSRNSGNGISAKYAILRKIALLAKSDRHMEITHQFQYDIYIFVFLKKTILP